MSIDNIPILWGDNEHDDLEVIRLLLKGGAAYDMRSSSMISAPTLAHLPPGVYRTTASSGPVLPGPMLRSI